MTFEADNLKEEDMEEFQKHLKKIMDKATMIDPKVMDESLSKLNNMSPEEIEKMNEIFAKYDAILMPVTIKTAPKKGYIEQNQEETFYSDIYTCLANITGIPAISVPVSKDNENMPIGIQLLCNRYEDDKLLNIANVLFKEMN